MEDEVDESKSFYVSNQYSYLAVFPLGRNKSKIPDFFTDPSSTLSTSVKLASFLNTSIKTSSVEAAVVLFPPRPRFATCQC
jgi:hypothetical protein